MATQINFNNLRPFPTDGTLQDSDLITIQQYGSNTPMSITWARFKTLVGSGGGGSIIEEEYFPNNDFILPDFIESEKKAGYYRIDNIYGDTIHSITINGNNLNGVDPDKDKLNIIRREWAANNISYTVELREIPDDIPPVLISAATNTLGSLITITVNKTIGSQSLNFFKNATTFAGSISNVGGSAKFVPSTSFEPTDLLTVSGTITDLSGNILNLTSEAIDNNLIPPLIQDRFNSANVTNIAGRNTPIGNKTWLHDFGSGTVGIVTNEVTVTSSILASNEYYVLDAGKRNIDVTFTIGSTIGDLTLYVCYTDTDNYISYITSLGAILIREAANNNIIFNPNIASISGDIIRIIVTTTTITTFKNSVQTYTGTTGGNLLGQKAGFSFYQTDASLNDITIY